MPFAERTHSAAEKEDAVRGTDTNLPLGSVAGAGARNWQKALDQISVFGEGCFDHLVSQYVEHYHTERPHQAKENVPLTGEWVEQEGDPDPDAIVCRTRLGGVLKHYEPAA